MKNTLALLGVLTVLLVAAALPWAPAAAAATQPVHIAAGVNGAWLDGTGAAFPADLEAGGTAWSSLTPHLSAVGGAVYGFSHSYARYWGGARMTSSDVLNPNFNTFLGAGYRGGSTAAVGPNEWYGDAGFGVKPLPAQWPALTLGMDAAYGLTSSRVMLTVAARWEIPLK